MSEARNVVAPRQSLTHLRSDIAATDFIPKRLAAGDGRAMAVASRSGQSFDDAGPEARSGRDDATRGETRCIQFVIGTKHESLTNEVRTSAIDPHASAHC